MGPVLGLVQTQWGPTSVATDGVYTLTLLERAEPVDLLFLPLLIAPPTQPPTQNHSLTSFFSLSLSNRLELSLREL